MSIKDTVQSVLTLVGTSAAALDAVGQTADSILGRNPTLEEALAGLAAISGVVKSIQDAMNGTTTPDTADAAVQDLQSKLAQNNAAADAAADIKFGAKASPKV